MRPSFLFIAAPISAVAGIAVTLVAPRDARADVTSWLALGSGYTVQHGTPSHTNDRAVALALSLGVGSSPRADWVFGGIVRGTTFLTLGTDLSVSARVATGGFARGQWGFAFDAGVVGRWWRDGDYGDYPVRLVATGGAPWGLQLALGADVFSVSGGTPARGFFGLIEIDLLRLTVMRQGATDVWWNNPMPAGGRQPQ